MPPSSVTYGEKLPSARAGGSSRPDEPSAIVAAMRAIAARQPGVSQRRTLGFMVIVSWGWGRGACRGWDRPGHALPTSLRMRGRRTQDGVVLAEDPIILLSVVLMALVARGDRVLGHLRLERILVAEAEVRPVAGLVLEALRVLDRGLQARELALEVAVAAGRVLCADAAELFNQDGAVPVLAGLLVLGEALGVHVDGVELGERGLAVVHVVGGHDLADVHPVAISDGPLELPVGRELDRRRRTTGRRGRSGQHVRESGDPDQDRDSCCHARPNRSKHDPTSSHSGKEMSCLCPMTRGDGSSGKYADTVATSDGAR